MTITRRKAVNIIRGTGGRIFTALFKKKDGTMRTMNCRLGVTSHLKGGELKFNPDDYKLMVVFDVQKKEYRMINLASLRRLRVNGAKYVIAKGKAA